MIRRLSWIDRRLVSATAVALVGMLLALAAAFAMLNDQARNLLQSHVEGSFARDLATLENAHETRGPGVLERALVAAAPVGIPRRMLAVDPSGRRIAGDLEGWPEGMPGETPFVITQIDGRAYYAATRTTPDGVRLLLAEQAAVSPLLTRPAMLAALVSLCIMLFAGLAVGAQFNGYVLERVSAVSNTARQIMRGQIEARVPEGRRLDPFDDLSRSFNEMLDQVEALVSGLRTVTDSLAHDLRTPLMRMRAAVSESRRAGSEAQRDALLARAEAEARHVLDTFTSLIDIARAESGLSRDSMESMDLRALALDVAELFEPVAAQGGRRLVSRLQAVRARAHRQFLFQAMTNLIENAIRHAPSGSDIVFALEAGNAERGPRFTVSDRGPGIVPEARGRAQRRFETLRAPAEGTASSGLGLAIAAAAARLHGGRLELADAGPGLHVVFELGRDQGEPASTEGTDRSEARGVFTEFPVAATVPRAADGRR